MYDKYGNVLRLETTVIHPEEFKVYRPKEGASEGPKAWRKLRRGVADLHRRAEVSQAANDRYLVALGSVTGSNSLHQEAASVCQPVLYHTRRYRALNPLCEQDYALLQAVSQASSPSRDYAIAIYEPSFTNPPSILCCDVVTRPPSLASSPYCAPMDCYAKFPIHTATSLRQKVVALSPPF